MTMRNDPFPLQGYRLSNGEAIPNSTVPWFLAEIAYIRYAKHHGRKKTLDDIAKAGGFQVSAFLDFICGGNGDGTAFRATVATRETSIKSNLDIITQGTKDYEDTIKQIKETADREAQRAGRLFYGSTGK